MGISEHTQDNQHIAKLLLTDHDRAEINAVLERSNARNMVHTVGDCGEEYRMPEAVG